MEPGEYFIYCIEWMGCVTQHHNYDSAALRHGFAYYDSHGPSEVILLAIIMTRGSLVRPLSRRTCALVAQRTGRILRRFKVHPVTRLPQSA